jgi:hypothetical protein
MDVVSVLSSKKMYSREKPSQRKGESHEKAKRAGSEASASVGGARRVLAKARVKYGELRCRRGASRARGFS